MNRAGCGERGRELPGPLQAWHHLPAQPRDHQPGGPAPDALQLGFLMEASLGGRID